MATEPMVDCGECRTQGCLAGKCRRAVPATEREAAAASELHAAIMNLPRRIDNDTVRHLYRDDPCSAYTAGHRDARHAAAELALSAAEPQAAAASEPVLVRLKRPEGYEDVHPQLVLEDAHINPAFEAEVVAPQPAAASERDGLRLGWTPPSPQRFDFDPKKPKPDHFMAYTVMQLHAAFDAGRALSRAPQAVRMLTDKDLHELWSQHWDGSDSVPYAFLAALGIVPLAPQDTGGK